MASAAHLYSFQQFQQAGIGEMSTVGEWDLECRNRLMEKAHYSEEGGGDPVKGESRFPQSKYVMS